MTSGSFKDLFSDGADKYASFRPVYPYSLFEFLAKLCENRELAWDCATGNGQALGSLSQLFNKVIATEASQKQLSKAPAYQNVEYRLETAENPSLAEDSVDLLTIAQALHWFNWDLFYPKAKRILKNNGVIAAIAYGLPDIHPEIDSVIREFHDHFLKNYWEQERQLVADLYKDVPFPFEPMATPEFRMEKHMTVHELIGYISTWSALKKYREINQDDPMAHFTEQLLSAWPSDKDRLPVIWPLACKVARIVK